MNIPINKDIENDYKSEIWKGLTLREVIFSVIAVAILGVSVYIGWFKFGVDPVISMYVGLPFAGGFVFLGIYKKQGMYLEEFLKVYIYFQKTKHLEFDAAELQEDDYVFSMSLEKEKRKRR